MIDQIQSFMNKKNIIIKAIIFLVATGIFVTIYFQSIHGKDLLANNSKHLFNLETHWAQGNAVALIRHTERCDRSDNICLEGDSGITVIGMEEAIKIGAAYNSLLTPHVTIYNSPVKRTVQSAKFMFGERSITKSWLREGCKEHLLDNIFKHKREGENLILVTHSTCIDALGKKHGAKLFDMSLHGEETYGGSFFIVIDSTRKLAHTLGYLDSHSLQNHQFNL